MRILVTGSVGFIGWHTVRKLIEAGHKIIGIDRNLPNRQGAGFGKYKPFRVDIRDAASLEGIFRQEQPEAVLHLAANSSLQHSISWPVDDADHNVMGTLRLLGVARTYNIKRFVFASTSAVYGPEESGEYYEDSLIAPQVPYGVSKAAGEMYVRCSGLSYAILRYGNVYGPGQKPLGENILIARALAHMIDGKPFKINGDGEQVRDWIFIEDVADANLAALFSETSGTFNIATGIGDSVNEVVQRLKNITGFHKSIEHGAQSKGELRSIILDSKLAREMLDWRPIIPLEMGLSRTAEAWMPISS